jgi:hypothetical protein
MKSIYTIILMLILSACETKPPPSPIRVHVPHKAAHVEPPDDPVKKTDHDLDHSFLNTGYY